MKKRDVHEARECQRTLAPAQVSKPCGLATAQRLLGTNRRYHFRLHDQSQVKSSGVSVASGVPVGRGVSVGSGVWVGSSVSVGSAVIVAVGVAGRDVAVGVAVMTIGVQVGVAVRVAAGVRVRVGVAVAGRGVGVRDGVAVAGCADTVCVGADVFAGSGVSVGSAGSPVD